MASKNNGTGNKQPASVPLFVTGNSPALGLPKTSIFFIIILAVSLILALVSFFRFKGQYFHIPVAVQYGFIIAGALAFFIKPEKEGKIPGAKDSGVLFLGLSRLDLLYLLVIFLFAFANRFYLLGEYPKGIIGESRLFLYKALEVASGTYPPSIYEPRNEWQVGTPIFYITAFFFKNFGVSLLSMEIFPALSAVAAVIFFYLFLRLNFTSNISVWGALVFAADHQFLHLSRYLHIFQITPMFVWGSFFLTAAGFKSRNRLLIILGGVAAGWGLYFYNANKLIPVLLSAYIAYELFARYREDKKIDVKNAVIEAALFFGALLMAALPLLHFIVTRRAEYFSHIGDVTAKDWNFIRHNFMQYAGIFTVKASPFSSQNFANRPLLGFIYSFLFLVGFGRALATINKRESFIALMLLAAGIISGTFSVEIAGYIFTQRVMLAIAGSSLFIVIALSLFEGIIKKRKNPWLYAIFLLFFAVAIAVETRTYFVTMAKDPEIRLTSGVTEYDIGKIYRENRANYDTYLCQQFTGEPNYSNAFASAELYFVDKISGKLTANYPPIMIKAQHSLDSLLLFAPSQKGVMLVTSSYYIGAHDFLKARFPGVVMERVKWDYGVVPQGSMSLARLPDYIPDIELVVYKIPASDISSYLGLRFTHDNVTEPAPVRLDGTGPAFQQKGLLTGSIRVFEDGEYRFDFRDMNASAILINNRAVKPLAPIKLYTGIYPIKIAVNSLTGKETMLAGRDNGPVMQLNTGSLVNENRQNGLKGTYYNMTDNKLIREEITPMVYQRWYLGAVRNRADSMRVKWEGRISIGQDGETEFMIDGKSQKAEVFIDGKKVYSKAPVNGRDEEQLLPVKLSKGTHAIRVVAEVYGYGNWTILKYKIPGSSEFVPVENDKLTY